MSPSLSFDGRAAMRWYVSIGVVLVAGILAGGDVASFAAPNPANRPGHPPNAAMPPGGGGALLPPPTPGTRPGHPPNAASRQLADKEANPTVDVELVLAV